MKRSFPNILLALFLGGVLAVACSRQAHTFHILETTDSHGSIGDGMASISSYTRHMKDSLGKDVLLLDCGDLLQGTPDIFYYTYEDTTHSHVFTDIMNFCGYDGITVGNHDFEVGKKQYDRLYNPMKAAVVNANVLQKKNQRPLFKPYQIYKRGKYKIAVLGLISSESLQGILEDSRVEAEYHGLFEAARYWVPLIREREKPDLLIGLFHARRGINEPQSEMHTCSYVARHVPGIDLICAGHDHMPFLDSVVNVYGKKVYLMEAGSSATSTAHAAVTLTPTRGGRHNVSVQMELVPAADYPPDPAFYEVVSPFIQRAHAYNRKEVCRLDTTYYSNAVLDGPCGWTDLLHKSYRILSARGEDEVVDITFASASIRNGKIQGMLTVGDFSWLYPYNNQLSVVEMTGKEIVKYLEYAYSLRLDKTNEPIYVLDSASGITYTVDRSAKKGKRIRVLKMTNGNPFYIDRKYHVAMTSFRALGGGGRLSKGLKWTPERMKLRIVYTTEEGIRRMMIDYYSQHPIDTTPLQEWSYIN